MLDSPPTALRPLVLYSELMIGGSSLVMYVWYCLLPSATQLVHQLNWPPSGETTLTFLLAKKPWMSVIPNHAFAPGAKLAPGSRLSPPSIPGSR